MLFPKIAGSHNRMLVFNGATKSVRACEPSLEGSRCGQDATMIQLESEELTGTRGLSS